MKLFWTGFAHDGYAGAMLNLVSAQDFILFLGTEFEFFAVKTSLKFSQIRVKLNLAPCI